MKELNKTYRVGVGFTPQEGDRIQEALRLVQLDRGKRLSASELIAELAMPAIDDILARLGSPVGS